MKHEEPTPRDVAVLLMALLVAFGIAIACGNSSARIRVLPPDATPTQIVKPSVKLYVRQRITQGLIVSTVQLEAQMRGEPVHLDDWLCLTAEWWKGRKPNNEAPIFRGPCGEVVPTRTFHHALDVDCSGVCDVGVVVRDRTGREIASDTRRVVLR